MLNDAMVNPVHRILDLFGFKVPMKRKLNNAENALNCGIL